MEKQQYVNINNDEKSFVVSGAIKTAAELVHCYNTFQAKTKKIDDVLCLEDKEILLQTLQEYLKEYGAFINSTTAITGFYIYQASGEQYNAMTVTNIKIQLRQLKKILMSKEILNSICQKFFEEYFTRFL